MVHKVAYEDEMHNLIKRGDRYYFNRRVPEELREYDKRELVRISLKTSNLAEAAKRAETLNLHVEKYWRQLLKSKQTHHQAKYENAIQIAKMWGVSYYPNDELNEKINVNELINRIEALEKVQPKEELVNAILGGTKSPALTIDKALDEFWKFSKDRIIDKSEDQIRKWENPRKKAIKNFIAVVGNKGLNELDRFDLLSFRDWWIGRIQQDDLNPSSANKDLVHVKQVLEIVSDNLKLQLDTSHLFKKLMLDDNWTQTRRPFETKYIRDTLLNPKNLIGLGDEEKHFLYAFADTGARGTELIGLDHSCIRLDHKIPHIKIQPTKFKKLKTVYSKRDIPLVGFALEAFKAYPKGFISYKDKPDNISNITNKFLREKHLFPSDQHSVYSLRHSFQDRLTSVDAPDRIQAELMGHKFNRPKYGDGPTLELKLEWMKKVALKN